MIAEIPKKYVGTALQHVLQKLIGRSITTLGEEDDDKCEGTKGHVDNQSRFALRCLIEAGVDMRDLVFRENKSKMREFKNADGMDRKKGILDKMTQKASLLQEVSDQLRPDMRAV